MNAIISVVGKDSVGILSKVSCACADSGVNIVEVNQSVLRDMFAMLMLVELNKDDVAIDELREKLAKVEKETNTKIHVMHEDIFNSMHRI
ncbi:MAG: ACT domain-containing protein [Ruminococcus sp.]|jgi:ACT domain-containing protein|nr:ACT domain-containing protein [Ruminococcus sp.]